jgi:hypothetical protein
LFAGAIAWCKNPHSHRRVGRSDAIEAARLITFASYLLTLAESREHLAEERRRALSIP